MAILAKNSLVILATLVTLAWTQTLNVEYDSRCVGEVSCTGCVSAGPACAWCKQWGFTGPRCERPDILLATGCEEENIYWRGSSELKLGRNEPLEDFGQEEVRRVAVQVRPQNALVRLRAGDAGINITLQFRAAKNYPLDVYYLMDLTRSMEDDKETLARLGSDLAHALSNLTTNFRFGFGSFVDKPVMPFVDQARLANPCSVEQDKCAPAYGFRHYLSLSRNTTQFTERVTKAQVSGNLDNAEGGLDALMQALACREQVGWARDARKIVLLASDGILHFAGDGKLGGAVRNNDGKCHMDPTMGIYTEADKQDYPSLGQINSMLQKTKVNVIFAVTRERLEHYARLKDVLDVPTFVAVLEEDSSNIIQLVRKGYKDIMSSVKFSDNSRAPLGISYHSACGEEFYRQTDSCDRIHEGQEYEFRLELHLNTCPSDPKLWKQQVKVEERSLETGLSLDVELLCGCDCESEENSSLCGGHGDLECGVCHCHDQWFGPTCGCTGRNATTADHDEGCLPREAAREGVDICWGRGDCVCGQCECRGESHGKFCQCDDTQCDRWGTEGARCGGPGRGRCVCGRCECETGWEGPSCSCPASDNECVPPGDSEVCSGRGNCECGQCVCAVTDDGRFTGKYCEKCDTCQGLCELYRTCVLCKVFSHECPDTGGDPCQTNTSVSYLDIVKELYVTENEESCKFIDPVDNCNYRFSYQLNKDRTVRLRVLDNKSCVPPINTAMFAGGIIALVVLVGFMLLLLWRCTVAAKDRYDYMRFNEETKKSDFGAGMNPLYKPAVTTYYVPDGFTEPSARPDSSSL